MKRPAALFVALLGIFAASAALADMKPAAKPAAAPTAAKPAAKPAAAAVDSLTLLERAVAKDSTRFDNLYKLGVLYLDRERMLEASRVLLKANQVRPKELKVLVNLGVAADAVGHADEAQVFYQQALDIAPGDSVAMCRLASSKYAQGKYDEAMTLLRMLMQTKPRSHCAYFTMGVAFADAGIYRDAIRMWHKVIELAPESPEAVSAKESIDVLEKFLQGK